IQTLLKDRFSLLPRREMKEMAAYVLVVVESGKMKVAADQTPWTTTPPQNSCKNRGPGLSAPANPMSSLANALSRWFRRPVVDQTNLQGLFDICLEFELDTDGSQRASPTVPIVLSSVLTQPSRAARIETGVYENTRGSPGNRSRGKTVRELRYLLPQNC